MLSSYDAPQLQPSSVDGQTAVRFAASPHSTIASSCVSGTRGSPSRRRRIAVPAAKGRLATTEKGSSGRRTSVASPSITSTRGSPPKRARSCRSAAGSSSTARTRAPASASARVRTPPPAPRSSTSVPGRTPASRTSSSAKARLRREWRPRGRACDEARPATENHGRHRLRLRDEVVGLRERLDRVLRRLELGLGHEHAYRVVLRRLLDRRVDARVAEDLLHLLRLGDVAGDRDLDHPTH